MRCDEHWMRMKQWVFLAFQRTFQAYTTLPVHLELGCREGHLVLTYRTIDTHT
jgi:hypothetical protein